MRLSDVFNLTKSFCCVIVVIASSCTINEEPVVTPKAFIKTPTNGFEVEINDTLLLEPQIAYDSNSTYEWSLNGVVIPNSNNRVMKVIPNSKFGLFNYRFKVTNDAGIDTLSILVRSLLKVDFEEFKLAAKSKSVGNKGFSVRSSKVLNLPVNNDTLNNMYWSGFAFSNLYTSAVGKLENQFSVYNGTGGDEKSNNFLVFHDGVLGENHFITFNDGKSHTVGLIALANTSYAYWTMKLGNTTPVANAFASPSDFFLVHITGYDENGVSVKDGNFLLADFRLGPKNYIQSGWVTIDLSGFGKISKLGFKFDSSDKDKNVIRTPTYFCLDNIRVVD